MEEIKKFINFTYLSSLDYRVFDGDLEEDENELYKDGIYFVSCDYDNNHRYMLYSQVEKKKRYVYLEIQNMETLIKVTISSKQIVDLWNSLIKWEKNERRLLLDKIDLD